MSLYFTSDQHFGHGAARGFYRRPFSSLARRLGAFADPAGLRHFSVHLKMQRADGPWVEQV